MGFPWLLIYCCKQRASASTPSLSFTLWKRQPRAPALVQSWTSQDRERYWARGGGLCRIAPSGRGKKRTSCWHTITRRGNLTPPSLSCVAPGTFASIMPSPAAPSAATSHSCIFSSTSSFILPNLFFCPREPLRELMVIIAMRPRAPILGI